MFASLALFFNSVAFSSFLPVCVSVSVRFVSQAPALVRDLTQVQRRKEHSNETISQ